MKKSKYDLKMPFFSPIVTPYSFSRAYRQMTANFETKQKYEYYYSVSPSKDKKLTSYYYSS